jgi:hypothetical protein
LHCLSCIRAVAVVTAVFLAGSAAAQTLVEDFTNVAALPGQGWVFRNNSSPAPTVNRDWSQGDTLVFPAQGSNDDSYIAASFESVGAGTPPGGTISNWLLTPTVGLSNGDPISFYTRTVDDLAFPDRLEVRLSVNGSSSNVGTTATSVGDFTRTLLTINPSLQTGPQGGDMDAVCYHPDRLAGGRDSGARRLPLLRHQRWSERHQRKLYRH